MHPAKKAEMAKVVFDLHLGFAIIFMSPADYAISIELIKGCLWALDYLVENIQEFLKHTSSVRSLLEGDMITKLFKQMKESKNDSPKKRLLNEIIIKLDQIFKAQKNLKY